MHFKTKFILYCCIAEYSEYSKNNKISVFQELRKQLLQFSDTDLILIGGDFNSRVATLNDFILEDETKFLNFPENYKLDTFTSQRINEDISINKFGEQLIDLCIASKLRILNGRTRGNYQGHFTYIGHNGCSSVDLVLASENILTEVPIIEYLQVKELNPLSDHKPILIKLFFNSIQVIEKKNR